MTTKASSSLNHKLILGCIIMLGFSLTFSVSLIVILKNNYDRADRSLQLLSSYSQILIAANRVSAERGPANALLGEESAADSPLHRKLLAFRANSDAALDAIRQPVVNPGQPGSSVDIEALRQQLLRARRKVDDVIAMPRSSRTPEDITDAIRGMFGVVDAIRPIASAEILDIVSQDQTLAGPVVMAQILGELREYAGRLSSHLMPYIAVHKPLPVHIMDDLNTTRGRISELWLLAQNQAGLYSDDTRLAAARRDVENLFFGVGLPIVYQTADAGRDTGEYGMTTAELTDRFVPTFEPVERIRSVFLDLTIERPAETRATALNWLIAVSLITIFCVAVNIALIFAGRRLIFKPLLTARDHIIALSEGNEIGELRDPGPANEMRHLFLALDELRKRLRERLHHTELLKIQAETDGLTGLMNRRSLDRIGLAEDDMPDRVGLIMMDLDNFKAINDTHGHLAGDRVLQCAAGIVRETIAETDIAARYGGEEIAVVVTSGDRAATLELAERIRAEFERSQIELPNGGHVSMTASFGVAVGARGGGHWQTLVGAADGALYSAKCAGRNRVILSQTIPTNFWDAA